MTGVTVCRQVNEELVKGESKFPHCSRLRKLYRDTYLGGASVAKKSICPGVTCSEVDPLMISGTTKDQSAAVNFTNSIVHGEYPVHEHTELGWDGSLDELALFMLIESCQCVGEEEELPILDEGINRIGISYRPHPQYKSVL